MTLLSDALRAGHSTTAPRRPPIRTALVVGGGGALGSAVLESLLANRRFARVRVLVTRALGTAMQGLEPVLHHDFAAAAAPGAVLADTALIVFDRARHANGRELAFLHPAPEALPAIAAWLHAHGVRALVIVLPHSPANLPEALKAGLANLDEQAVSAMGFDHLVIVRTAQPPAHVRGRPWAQRLADGLLAQLQIMLPSRHLPVRAGKVARFVAELAEQLAYAAPGTRVAPPELVWQAAQLRDAAPLVQAWLGPVNAMGGLAPRMRW